MVSITFPADGVTLSFELFGWRWCTHDCLLLTISSSSSVYQKSYCNGRPIWFISSQFFRSLCTHHAHTFWNFKRSCIMLYAKPWEHLSAVATLSIIILLLVRINSSTCCTVASVAISTGQLGWAPSATFKRPWEHFFMNEYPLHWVILPTKNAQQNAALW
jgi:hypothetical protein